MAKNPKLICMEFTNYFSLLRRYALYISIIAVISGVVALAFTKFFVEKESEILIFLSLGTEKSLATIPNESGFVDLIDAADKFGETMRGWFKNPGFLEKIQKNVNLPLQFTSVKKQALQNLVIEVRTQFSNNEVLKGAGDEILRLLNEEVKFYNERTKNSFLISTSYISYSTTYAPIFLNGFVAFLIGLFLSIVAFYLYEMFQGAISFESQIKEIFPKAPIFRLTGNENQAEAWARYVVGCKPVIILGATSCLQADDVLEFAKLISDSGTENLLLIDYEVSKASLSRLFDNKDGRGVTELKEGDSLENSYCREIPGYNFAFMPLGSKKKVSLEALAGLNSLFNQIVIFTILPKYSDILGLENSLLVLPIVLGKTKIKDLQLIKRLYSAEIIPVLI